MHPLTYRVYKSIPTLEFEQFRHLEDRERLNEIRALAKEQVNDDTATSPQETYWGHGSGRGKTHMVQRPGGSRADEADTRWPEYSERQRAIITGMEPSLDMVITAEQRVLLRQVYDEQADQRTIARRYGINQSSLNRRLQTIHKHLREALLKVYGPQEES